MKNKHLIFLFIRYIFLAIFALGNLYIFYLIFTPLTYFSSLWAIKTFYIENFSYAVGGFNLDAGNLISLVSVNGQTINANIIPACIAGAAYYLLTIFNLTTPMKFTKRIASLFFILGIFFLLNTTRIIIFMIFLINGNTNFFDIAHSTSWYFGSTALIILIWFANVLIFRIKSIPIYSDLKNLFNEATKPTPF
jgi:exosortase/archaeosortase family protein